MALATTRQFADDRPFVDFTEVDGNEVRYNTFPYKYRHGRVNVHTS